MKKNKIDIFEIDKNDYQSNGKTNQNVGGFDVVVKLWIVIYTHPSTLYHLLDHEMVHVEQYVSGRFDAWTNAYGEHIAIALAEMKALQWNYDHLPYFPIAYGKRDLDQKFRAAGICMMLGICPEDWYENG